MSKNPQWQPILSPEHIKRIRKSFGESQSAFAKRLGVDTVTVARWETGQRKCSGQHATAIARLDKSGNPLVKDILDSSAEFSNFTDRALKAVLLSQAETHRQGRHYIGTEQLLLGLIGEGRGTAAICLRSTRAYFGFAEVLVECRDGTGPYAIFKEQALSSRTQVMLSLQREQTRFHILNFGIEYSARAQLLLHSALRESELLGHETVGTGHLLLSLLNQENSGAIEILSLMGVDRDQLRRELQDRLSTPEGPLDLEEGNSRELQANLPVMRPFLSALEQLREATEMSFLQQDYDLGITLREQELQLWKKLVTL